MFDSAYLTCGNAARDYTQFAGALSQLPVIGPKQRRYVARAMPGEDGFAEYLRRAMQRRGLRRVDLARQSDVSPTAITRWLNDQQQPQAEQLVKIAGPLGVRVEDLLVAAGHVPALGSVSAVETTEIATEEARIVAAATDAADPLTRAQIVSVVRALTTKG